VIPDFSQFTLTTNATIFSVAAVAVWIGGVKVADYAGELAQRFNLSHANLGLFLLAGITSLPEMATSFSAAGDSNAELAVNNLLGSITMQVALLAVADLVFGKRALTSVVPDSLVILQGALNIILLALVTVAITVGDMLLFGAGSWSWGLLGATVYCMFKLYESERLSKPWIVNPDDEVLARQQRDKTEIARYHREKSHGRLFVMLLVSASVILMAGFTVARVGEAIAEQSGLGQSFVGVALVAIATSLPEASTVFATMRRGFYTMAISDILGTNILNIALISGVDLIDPGGPVLDRVGDFSVLAGALGITVTGLFLMGVAERSDRTIGRMGVDSFLVLATYGAGLYLLFQLRAAG